MKPSQILAGALFGLAVIFGSLFIGVSANAQSTTTYNGTTTSTTTLPNTGGGYGQ